MVASPSLDETHDVERLIPGNLSAIRKTSVALADTESDFVAIAEILSQVEVAGWRGAAAHEFRKKWHDLPESWAAAGRAYRHTHKAVVEYLIAFETARSAAEDAVTLHRRGQDLSAHALARFHADQEARAAETGGKPYVPGPKSVALAQGFHDPGESFRHEAQQDLDDARTRLHRSAHTASEAILGAASGAPKVPPTGWDQFWGGVNGVVEFPGNVVEGFLLAGWDTIASVWSTAPAKFILELMFSGPDVTWKDLTTTGEGEAAAVMATAKDPIGSMGTIIGDALDFKEWGTNPGHVIGNGLVLVASFAVPGGAPVKADKVGDDAEKLVVDGSKVAPVSDAVPSASVTVPGTTKQISTQLRRPTSRAFTTSLRAKSCSASSIRRGSTATLSGPEVSMYVDLGADWDKVKAAQGLDNDDMFRLYNLRFLDDCIDKHKEIFVSHDPRSATGYLKDEYVYLRQNGYEFDPTDNTMYRK